MNTDHTQVATATVPLAVVIVNYNTRTHLQGCLDSLVAQLPAELIVVDVGSTDGSVELVQRSYPQVKLVCNSTGARMGYGEAANLGVAAATSPFMLVLNSDTILEPQALTALYHYMLARPEVGIAGPRLLNPDGSLQISTFPYPEPLHMLIRESSLLNLIGWLPVIGRRYLLTWPHDMERQVPWVLGAALLLRREAFAAVGGFDPDFFMYSEEVDLCYRIARAGWQVRFTPVTELVHVGGASVKQMRSAMLVQLYRSRLRFYEQHYSTRQLSRFKILLTYFMLRNLIRDLMRLRRTSEERKQARIASDIRTWKEILCIVA